MKKIFFAASAVVLMTVMSCKKETNTVIATEDGTDTLAVVQTEETNVLSETDAKAKVEQAKADLDAAIKSGDKAAEEHAKKALSDAEQAWEDTKVAIHTASEEVKDGVNNAIDKTNDAAKDAKKDLKTATDNVKNDVDKAAQDTKEATKKAASDVKDAYNKTLESVKAK